MAEELTPMMRQYRRIKTELPDDVVLMFRLGDFYEMFFEDAQLVSQLLGLTLTRRAGVPMCGVPYHALESHLAKLMRLGRKAAICDQMEDPATAKGIVRREVTRIVTPGTITEDSVLEASRNNFLVCVSAAPNEIGLAALDLSTGAFSVETVSTPQAAIELLRSLAPSETVVGIESRGQSPFAELEAAGVCGTVTEIDDWTLQHEAAYERLLRHFKVQSLRGYGCEDAGAAVSAAGALLQYVGDRLRREVGHIRTLRVNRGEGFVTLDETTCYHLDMLPYRDHPLENTLLGVMDVTRTSMGARLLRRWFVRPLRARDDIVARHDAVEYFTAERMSLSLLREQLAGVRDLERLIAKLGTERGNARDANALATSLEAIPDLLRTLASAAAHVDLLSGIASRLHAMPELAARIRTTLLDEPSMQIKEGGLIRPGVNAQLDEFRALATEGHTWLAQFQAREIERTGIKTLKVRHNKVFGYYIEISKGLAAQAPADYERRQTLVNAERFVTPELKEHERKIFGATEKSQALEYELFCALRSDIAACTGPIQETAQALAELDCLLAFADRALALGYVRPTMTMEDRLEIRDGRHPVIEQLPDAEPFVPNDTLLDCSGNQIMLITGPNMAGKSTYIRQVALIAIMAHVGSFVPASSATISLLDRVFTRVGAGDDLARGRSTFMVEMQETANILNNATPRSLLVLDEIGRGTSTFDGISIAWSVAEHLHNTPAVKAKTLFATHYHELTDLAGLLPGVKNYTVLVRERGDEVAFLRRIAPGTADKSYGIQVAALAGMPREVVSRAKSILKNLEEGGGEVGMPKFVCTRRKRKEAPENQLNLFD